MSFWNLFGASNPRAIQLVKDIAAHHHELIKEAAEKNKELLAMVSLNPEDLTDKKMKALENMRDVYFALAVLQTLYEKFIHEDAKRTSYHNFRTLSRALRKPYLTEEDVNKILVSKQEDVEPLLKQALDKSLQKENVYGTR